jgi:hypothetical protein
VTKANLPRLAGLNPVLAEPGLLLRYPGRSRHPGGFSSGPRDFAGPPQARRPLGDSPTPRKLADPRACAGLQPAPTAVTMETCAGWSRLNGSSCRLDPPGWLSRVILAWPAGLLVSGGPGIRRDCHGASGSRWTLAPDTNPGELTGSPTQAAGFGLAASGLTSPLGVAFHHCGHLPRCERGRCPQSLATRGGRGGWGYRGGRAGSGGGGELAGGLRRGGLRRGASRGGRGWRGRRTRRR